MKYYFSAFIYDTEQKVLMHQEDVLDITKKNHALLLYLLKNPQRLVSRNELIDQVWNGRVVTNNTIDQCILKLRKALNQAHQGDYIETVYGQGIRFIPAVGLENPVQIETAKQNDQVLWTGLFSMMLIVSVGYWLFSEKRHEVPELAENKLALQKNVSIEAPKQAAKDDWLLDGGSTYLSYLLQRYPNLNLNKIQRNTGDEDDNPSIDISLLKADQSKINVHVVLFQKPATKTAVNSYHADINITSHDTKLAHDHISADKLTQLFPQIAQWVAQYDGSESPEQVIDPNVFTQNEQALLSFFRGLVVQVKGNSEEALKYFNRAVELDPEFKLAWYEMSIAVRLQGDPKKSISILNAIQTDDQWLSFRVAIAKGNTHKLLGDLTAASASYEQALQFAKATANLSSMTFVYTNLAILYSDMNQYVEAEQQLLKALEYTDISAQPNMYGSVMNTYSKIAIGMNNFPLAAEKSQLAVKAYKSSGNSRYEMHAKTRLARVLLIMNEFSQAELLTKESLSHAEQLNNTYAISSNRTNLAVIYKNTGRFQLAIEAFDKAIGLDVNLELYDKVAEIYLSLLEIYLHKNDMAKAQVTINLLVQLYNEHQQDEINQIMLEAKLKMALYNQDISSSQQLLDALILNDHKFSKIYQGDLAKLQNKYEEAELYYLEALLSANANGHFSHMVLIMNKLNALYLNYKTHKLAQNLQRTAQLKPFIYPLQKYQALAAIKAGNQIKAISLLEELKLKAGEFWQAEEQKIFERTQESSSD